MNGEKEERAGGAPQSGSTVESYHDIAASREEYESGEDSASASRSNPKGGEGPLPGLIRRERDWLVGTVKERGRQVIFSRISFLAAVAHDVAELFHSSAQRLSSQEDTAAAHYFDLAADGIDKMAATLENQNFETLVSRTRDFARTHPALFFGGVATAGFMASRFLKSSTEPWEQVEGWHEETTVVKKQEYAQ